MNIFLRYDKYIALIIVFVHTLLIAFNGYVHSPVIGEIGHLAAGISHWRSGRFDLYRVNPPLVRMVATLPILFMDPSVDWSRYDADPLARSETAVGIDFSKANGTRIFWLYTVGRWVCIPFSWIGCWACYFWARRLHGRCAGLIALMLWCSCPNILGNGSLIMPDVPAAALGVAACYAFWRWLERPAWTSASVAGALLGIAELTKLTLIILYPIWPAIWLLYRLSNKRFNVLSFLKETGMLFLQLGIAIYLLNLGYAFEGTCKRLDEYHFKSQALSGLSATEHLFSFGNRFTQSTLGSLPVPFPKNYIQGLDAQKFDFESGLRSYLRGRWRDRGWWYFYFYGLSIKIPLGTWLLVVVATVPAIRARRYSITKDSLVLIPIASIMGLLSTQDGFSIHFRYVMPALPFLFIWASRSAQVFESKEMVGKLLVVVGLSWSVGSSLRYFPHSLSYFNELAGGPNYGDRHLLDSSIAWGQDLLLMRDWYRSHPDSRPLYFASFGFVDPRLAGIEFTQPSLMPCGTDARAFLSDEPGPSPGWYAVDVNYLHGSTQMAPDGKGGFEPLWRDGFGLCYLKGLEPIERVGYSIRIYRLDAKAVWPAQDHLDDVQAIPGQCVSP